MTEIQSIIAAFTALVLAIGGVVTALSKLGPVIKELNRFLNDRTKRLADAKSKTPIKTTARKSETVKLLPFTCACIIVPSIILGGQLVFSRGPADASTVVTSACAVIIFCIAIGLIPCILLLAILAGMRNEIENKGEQSVEPERG